MPGWRKGLNGTEGRTEEVSKQDMGPVSDRLSPPGCILFL